MGRILSLGTALACGLFSLFSLGQLLWANDYYVDPTGAIPGSYTTVQAALDGVPSGTAGNRSVIRIAPGTYVEKLTLGSSKSYLTLLGATTDAADTVLSFNLNATSDNGSGGTVGTTGSTSTTINGDDILAANLTFANSTPDNVAQAVALKTNGDRIAFQNCRFIGFQDTLYIDGPAGDLHRIYIRDSFITGDTDFIFGRGTAVFENSVINSSDRQYITAPRTEASNPYGFVFIDSTLEVGPNPDITPTPNGAANNSTYLARPWQYDSTDPVVQSKTVFIDTKMGPHIISAGWNPWDSGNTNPEQTTYFAEYNSMDLAGNPLNVANRVPWSHQLTAQERANYTLANILGRNDGWDPLADLATIPEVPEPGTLVLAIVSVATLVLARRRVR